MDRGRIVLRGFREKVVVRSVEERVVVLRIGDGMWWWRGGRAGGGQGKVVMRGVGKGCGGGVK